MEQRELIEKYVSNDDIYLYNTGNAQRAYHAFGCRYIPDCGLHRFVVWAPHAREVSVVGDFNGWDGYASPMYRREDGVWCAFLPNVKNGDIYKYRIVGADGNTVLKARPLRLPRRDRARDRLQGLGYRGLRLDRRRLHVRPQRTGMRYTPPCPYTRCTWAPGASGRTRSSPTTAAWPTSWPTTQTDELHPR